MSEFHEQLNKATDEVRDLTAAAGTPEERETARAELTRAAGGLLESKDQRAVFVAGFILVGIVFIGVAVVAAILVMDEHSLPDSLSTLATALISGVVGGLFGLAKPQAT